MFINPIFLTRIFATLTVSLLSCHASFLDSSGEIKLRRSSELNSSFDCVPMPKTGIHWVGTECAIHDVLEAYEKTCKKAGADKIVMLFDLDGTLTNVPTPRHTRSFEDFSNQMLETNVQKRSSASELFAHMENNGTPFVISSAWDHFNETAARLVHVGLGSALDQGEISVKDAYEQEYSLKADDCMEWIQQGKVTSVRLDSTASPFYVDKLYSLKVTYPDLDWSAIQYIFFIEDSMHNLNRAVDQFKAMRQEYFPGIKMLLTHLKREAISQ
jgi:hypothetical protein